MVDSPEVATDHGTNRARRSLTSLMWRTPLPLRQTSRPVTILQAILSSCISKKSRKRPSHTGLVYSQLNSGIWLVSRWIITCWFHRFQRSVTIREESTSLFPCYLSICIPRRVAHNNKSKHKNTYYNAVITEARNRISCCPALNGNWRNTLTESGVPFPWEYACERK